MKKFEVLDICLERMGKAGFDRIDASPCQLDDLVAFVEQGRRRHLSRHA